MKLFILSDIHGSVPAFVSAMAAFEREAADWLVLCGDYLNHGPRNPLPAGYDPKALAPLLNAHADRIVAARGNCDSEVDQMLLAFPCLADYALVLANGRRVIITHGHLPESRLPPLRSGDILVSGHTHVPVLEVRDGVIYLNPGSPALPKDGSEGGYAIVDSDSIALKTLDGAEIKRLKMVLV
jgi:putative phosphoesterase